MYVQSFYDSHFFFRTGVQTKTYAVQIKSRFLKFCPIAIENVRVSPYTYFYAYILMNELLKLITTMNTV